jgi:hypothetical protein
MSEATKKFLSVLLGKKVESSRDLTPEEIDVLIDDLLQQTDECPFDCSYCRE